MLSHVTWSQDSSGDESFSISSPILLHINAKEFMPPFPTLQNSRKKLVFDEYQNILENHIF